MLKWIIPDWLRRQWSERATARRVAGNTAWLAADQIVRLGVGFIVTVWVARYLGVNRFGQLNYAIAFCAPFAALVSLSLNAIAVRDLVREPEHEGEVLGTTFGMKVAGALVALIVGSVAVWRIEEAEAGVRLLVLLVLAGTVLQAGDVFDLWFQGKGEARIGGIIRSSSFLVLAMVKLLLVFLGAPLVWFAAATSAEVALCTSLFAIGYLKRRAAARWRFSGARALRLVGHAWPLALAGIAVQVQAYFDQVLLAGIRGADEVGIYSAALRLIAVFGFIPMAVQTAAAPEITRAHSADPTLYVRRLRDVYRLVIGGSALVAIPLLVVPDVAINIVFGAAFAPAAAFLPLLTVRLMLTSLGVARGLFITNEGLFRHAAVTAIAGMVVNIALNLLLIPGYGGMGCVVAALVSFTVTTILLDAFNSRARFNLRILAASIGIGRLPV